MAKSSAQFQIISKLHPEEDKIMEPYWYHRRQKKTDLMVLKLSEAFNEWLKIPKEPFEKIFGVVDFCFDAGIMLDDIQDSSTLRRGLPSAYCVYGIPLTINALNYGFFYGMQKMIDFLPLECIPTAFEIYNRFFISFYRGQGMDIYWRDSFTCPSTEKYLGMIVGKTDPMGIYIELMQYFSEDKRDYSRLLGLIYQYFMIRDDYANLTSPEVTSKHTDQTFNNFIQYSSEHGYYSDITEGKFSFPVIHAINSNPADTTILDILKQRTTDRKLLQFAVDRLTQMGSLAYTLKVLTDYEAQIYAEIDRLGGNEKLKGLIMKFSDMLMYFN